MTVVGRHIHIASGEGIVYVNEDPTSVAVNAPQGSQIVFLGSPSRIFLKDDDGTTTNVTEVTDHGALRGLSDDDHGQYSLVSGARAFDNEVAGVTPTVDASLATKGYVDAEVAGASSVKTTAFTANGTWTPDAAIVALQVVCGGDAGGGGSGAKSVTNADTGGGASGGGGAISKSAVVTYAALGSPTDLPVVVGQGGPGGAAQTSDATAGNDGANGTGASFGSFARAGGGGGGRGGRNNDPSETEAGGGGGEFGDAALRVGGVPNVEGNAISGQGPSAVTGGGNARNAIRGGATGASAGAAVNGGAGQDGGSSVNGGPAGGSGGSITGGTNSPKVGGAGGEPQSYTAGGGPAGGAVAAGGAPGVAASTLGTLCGSGGGGGGAAVAGATDAGPGGAGGVPCAAGGGGGGVRNGASADSGAGGNGARGFVTVIEYLA